MTDQTSLEHFIQNVCNESHLRIEDDLGDGFVRLCSEEAERRQALQDIRCSEDVVIEMLRNARDAGATHIFLASSRHANDRTLCMIDDGSGIPEHLHTLIFEPRVTSKLDTMHMDTWGVHGRGMALYSIYHNAKSACVTVSGPGLGSAFFVSIDTTSLKEKTDQSSFPTFQVQDSHIKVLGPKNITRITCEFALESKNLCMVTLGTATEIAAALYRYGMKHMTREERLFASNLDDVPVCCRLSCASDPDAFAEIAAELGLELSSRSARRILNGEIDAPCDLLSLIKDAVLEEMQKQNACIKSPNKAMTSLLSKQASKGLQIHPDDKQQFAHAIAQAYKTLAASYYLHEDIVPEISIGKTGIRIHIPFEPMD